MNKQQKQQMFSIRKKLLAAVAMLLVACIMTVSSTYAWFTLSTAPEVKGITTTVGANGNLEIALGEYDTIYGSGEPDSGIGDSSLLPQKGDNDRNTTWGNLIDLSHSSYGLDQIKLYPTRLNTDGNTIQYLAPLKYPAYGADGRITELKDGTMLGDFTQGNGFSGLLRPDFAGVNAVGAPSEMSEREFAVFNNKSLITSYTAGAMNAAKSAMNLYGGELAQLALDNQDATPDKVIDAEDVELLRNLVAKLQESNENIGYAVRSAMLVYLAGDESLSDEAWSLAVSYIVDKTLEEINAQPEVTWPNGTEVYYNEYHATGTMLSDALTTLPVGASTWETVSGVVNDLLNPSKIKICGETVPDILSAKANTDVNDGITDAFEMVIEKALSGGLEFGFADGSGIFSDIAKMTGDYTAYITFPAGMSVEGIPIGGPNGLTKPVAVEKTTEAAVSSDSTSVGAALMMADGLLPALGLAVSAVQAPDGDDSAVQALTDTFGYTIDFLFRTNATDSYLQLQTDAADRIYSDNPADASTRGDGSYMAFEISEEYNTERISNLMDAVRVVFYENPGAGSTANILGVATLDTAAGVTEAGYFRAPLVLQKDYVFDANGRFTPGTAADDAKLKALTANVATKVTALVYLDGDLVDNTMVGFASNMTGSMNLQFSSSASLTPMEYNDLHTAA